MAATFSCPHCQYAVPDQPRGRGAPTTFLCPKCRAPLKFEWKRDLAGGMLGAAVCVLGMVIFMPLIKHVIVLNVRGEPDKNNWVNWLAISPFVALGLYVSHLAHMKYGRVVLANRKWPLRLSQEERKIMRTYGISANAEYFAVGTMHFDTLQQAVEYARTRRGAKA